MRAIVLHSLLLFSLGVIGFSRAEPDAQVVSTGYTYEQPRAQPFGWIPKPPRPGQPAIDPPRPGYGGGPVPIQPNKGEWSPEEKSETFEHSEPEKLVKVFEDNSVAVKGHEEESDPRMFSLDHIKNWLLKDSKYSNSAGGFYEDPGFGHLQGGGHFGGGGGFGGIKGGGGGLLKGGIHGGNSLGGFGGGISGIGGFGGGLGGGLGGIKGLKGGGGALGHGSGGSCISCSPFFDYFGAQRCCSLGYFNCCPNVGVGSLGGGSIGWPSSSYGPSYGSGIGLGGIMSQWLPSIWGILFPKKNGEESYNYSPLPHHFTQQNDYSDHLSYSSGSSGFPPGATGSFDPEIEPYLIESPSKNPAKNEFFPVPVIHETRFVCPISSPIIPSSGGCRKECSNDSECYGIRMCCRFSCSYLCSNPTEIEVGELSGNSENLENGQQKYTGSFALTSFPPQSHSRSSRSLSKNATKVPNSSASGFLSSVPQMKKGIVFKLENLVSKMVGNKPGSCYRPPSNSGGYYRARRQADDAQARHYNPGGGGYGGGGYGPIQGGNGIGGGYQQCYRDYDCPGNKKCCSGTCNNPAYFG